MINFQKNWGPSATSFKTKNGKEILTHLMPLVFSIPHDTDRGKSIDSGKPILIYNFQLGKSVRKRFLFGKFEALKL